MTELQNNKPIVIVTGSTGLIGSAVVADCADDHTVIGMDIAPPEDGFPGADWVKCDLTSDDSVDQAFNFIEHKYRQPLSSVVHLAAYYDFSGEPDPMYEALTVGGTERLIRKLRQFDVEQFIFSSSLLVMEPVADEDARLTEDSPTRAEWAYPKSKLAAEQVLRDQHGSIPLVILRIAGVYDEDCHSLPLSRHIRRIYEKRLESYFFPGDSDHGQPFVHRHDVVRCFRQAIDQRRRLDAEELFLIAEPEIMSHADLQERLGAALHGTEWPTIRVPKVVARVGARVKDKLSKEEAFIKPWMVDLADDHYPVEIDRAIERLGWMPRHRLEDVLGEMIQRFQRDPAGWYQRHDLELPEDLAKDPQQAGASGS